MVEIEEKYSFAKMRVFSTRFLGSSWKLGQLLPECGTTILCTSDCHLLISQLTDLTYWNKFVIFVNDKYFNKQVYF